jgi:hypothetical protein
MQKMLAKVRRVATFWTDDFWLCAGERRQTLDAQVLALKAVGTVRVFHETANGAKTDRRGRVASLPYG